MASVEFYDVKTRKKINVDDKDVTKTKLNTKNGQVRYALRGKTTDGRTVTKFVSAKDYDKLQYKEAIT